MLLRALAQSGFSELPVTAAHAARVAGLPAIHSYSWCNQGLSHCARPQHDNPQTEKARQSPGHFGKRSCISGMTQSGGWPDATRWTLA
jgi:hypothetical protein